MLRWPAAAVALALVLAGCVASPEPAAPLAPGPERTEAAAPPAGPEREDHPPAPQPEAPLVADDAEWPSPLAGLVEVGPAPWWVAQQTDVACPCPGFRIELAEDLDADAWLEVRVLWDGTKVPDLNVTLDTPQGTRLAGERGFDERRVQAFAATRGPYVLHIGGTGEAELRVLLKSLDGPPGARLPNLVTMRPQDLHIGSCDAVETLEQGARRCLRFGNGIGNTGWGPLQVRLTLEEAALAPVGSGLFVQEVLQSDGTMAPREAAQAEFHLTHAHWHYDGVAGFALHAVDPETGLRKDEVAAHHKSGFCLLDWDQMDSGDTDPGAGQRAETACLVPWVDGWTMGISQGWYDFYGSGLTDQYVDVEGLPDGVYEFVSSADSAGTLEEWDRSDNKASVLLRLDGDAVKVLEPRALYQVQPADEG